MPSRPFKARNDAAHAAALDKDLVVVTIPGTVRPRAMRMDRADAREFLSELQEAIRDAK